MDWEKLILKKCSRKEVSEFTKDPVWQDFRKTIKGLTSQEKYSKLTVYLEYHNTHKARVQVTNYVGALKRAGLIK